MPSRSIVAFLLWRTADCARPETEILDETRLLAAAPSPGPATSIFRDGGQYHKTRKASWAVPSPGPANTGPVRKHIAKEQLWEHAFNGNHAHAHDVLHPTPPPKKSTYVDTGEEVVLKFPRSVGLYHIGMKPP